MTNPNDAPDIIPAPSFAVIRLLEEDGTPRRRPVRIDLGGDLPRAVVLRSGAPGKAFADGEVLDGQTVLIDHLGYPVTHSDDDDFGIRIVSIDHIVAVVCRRPTTNPTPIPSAMPRRLGTLELENYAKNGCRSSVGDVEAMAAELLERRRAAIASWSSFRTRGARNRLPLAGAAMIDLMRGGLPRLVEFDDGGVTHRWVLLYWIMRASRDGWSVYLAVDPLAPMPAPVVMTTAPDNARTLPVVNGEIVAADPTATTKEPR